VTESWPPKHGVATTRLIVPEEAPADVGPDCAVSVLEPRNAEAVAAPGGLGRVSAVIGILAKAGIAIVPLWLEFAVRAPATQASGGAPTNRNEAGPFRDRRGVFPNMVKQLQRRMVKGRLSGLVKSGE
jgi:hypothetical protein